MLTPVKLPKLGVEMRYGKVIEWKIADGEWVEKDHDLLVIETDKITYDMLAPESGYIKIIAPLNADLPIGELLGMLASTREELNAAVIEKTPTSNPPDAADKMTAQSPSTATQTREVRISSLARKLAEENGINIDNLTGTGPQQRITKEDVMQAIENQKSATTTEKKTEITGPVQSTGKEIRESLELKGMRKVIADRMYNSLNTAAQYSECGEIDATSLVAFRHRLNERLKKDGKQIAYMSLYIKAISIALGEHPMVNASIIDGKLVQWKSINIGFAVSVEDGLLVPVVHNADRLSTLEIEARTSDLIDRARRHALKPDEISHGTFTITNVGSYGALFGTPIINPPEAAILAIGTIAKRPAVIDDTIVIRSLMNYSLTMDHRIIDGIIGGRFVQRIRQLIETPELIALY